MKIQNNLSTDIGGAKPLEQIYSYQIGTGVDEGMVVASSEKAG